MFKRCIMFGLMIALPLAAAVFQTSCCTEPDQVSVNSVEIRINTSQAGNNATTVGSTSRQFRVLPERSFAQASPQLQLIPTARACEERRFVTYIAGVRLFANREFTLDNRTYPANTDLMADSITSRLIDFPTNLDTDETYIDIDPTLLSAMSETDTVPGMSWRFRFQWQTNLDVFIGDEVEMYLSY